MHMVLLLIFLWPCQQDFDTADFGMSLWDSLVGRMLIYIYIFSVREFCMMIFQSDGVEVLKLFRRAREVQRQAQLKLNPCANIHTWHSTQCATAQQVTKCIILHVKINMQPHMAFNPKHCQTTTSLPKPTCMAFYPVCNCATSHKVHYTGCQN